MKVSVIMPVYNEENTLEEILKRVKAQQLASEIVIVDEFQIKALRLGKVHLIRSQRKLAPNRTPNLHINLGTVESRLV